ncbi:MAG: PQQ-binding-like beta-propeller repeat protein, partial [Candidatus Aenigmatarchaeota archaeon]
NAKTGNEIWRFKAGAGITFTPIIYENKVYFGCQDHYFYCLDKKSGKEVWRFRAGDRIGGGPCFINENKLYFCCKDNHVYCLDTNKGKEIWRFKTNNENWSNIEFFDGKIYFGSMDCHVYCLDAETGELIWMFETSTTQPATYRISEEVAAETVIKKKEYEKIEEEEKYNFKRSGEIGFSDYMIKSEYLFKSEYQTKSDYK